MKGRNRLHILDIYHRLENASQQSRLTLWLQNRGHESLKTIIINNKSYILLFLVIQPTHNRDSPPTLVPRAKPN